MIIPVAIVCCGTIACLTFLLAFLIRRFKQIKKSDACHSRAKQVHYSLSYNFGDTQPQTRNAMQSMMNCTSEPTLSATTPSWSEIESKWCKMDKALPRRISKVQSGSEVMLFHTPDSSWSETALETPTETALETPTETALEMPTETALEMPAETALEMPTESVFHHSKQFRALSDTVLLGSRKSEQSVFHKKYSQNFSIIEISPVGRTLPQAGRQSQTDDSVSQ